MKAKRNINRNNYEEFFIDFLDGKLSANELCELESFLLANPDLGEELEGMEKISVLPVAEYFSGKEYLYQPDLSEPVSKENFHFFSIAAMEGDLVPEQLAALEEFLSRHPELVKEHHAFAQTRLSPDQDIVYIGKALLKKRFLSVYRREIYQGLSIAAGIALVAGMFFMLGEPERKDYAVTSKPVQEEVIEAGKAESDSAAQVKQTPRLQVREKAVEKKDSITMPVTPVRKKEIYQTLSIQAGMPVASADNQEMPEFNPKDLRINIDPSVLKYPVPEGYTSRPVEVVAGLKTGRLGTTLSQPNNYLTLQEFAKQKLSSIILGEANEDELSIWSVANAGLDKINSRTGGEMKLQRNLDERGRTTHISFSSRLLSFSAPLKKEE